jgi:CubicO group peptidase (beta-lactamase class C family)
MPLDRERTVSLALVTPPQILSDEESAFPTIYHQACATMSGAYPYPLEMRFGVRSVMKSIGAPLSLLRLAQVYGPHVLNLCIGDHVTGLDPKYHRVRFIDAANMATGFGGVGTLQTMPNDIEDGHLDGDYDGWYTARSHAEKMAHIRKWLRPYPWAPGTVLRYRDQDYYLLGAALNNFLKSIRGAHADIWEMLCQEVFAPIGIFAAPTTRTREPLGELGLAWFNAGYFPTLDDLAKITLLYQQSGAWNGKQILHRSLTASLLAAEGAISKRDGSVVSGQERGGQGEDLPMTPTHYRMGFHFTPHYSPISGRLRYLPTMWGSGESEVILYPNGIVSIRIGKAASLGDEVFPQNEISWGTIETVQRLAPW